MIVECPLSFDSKILIDGYNPHTNRLSVLYKIVPLPVFSVQSYEVRETKYDLTSELKRQLALYCKDGRYYMRQSTPLLSKFFSDSVSASKFWCQLQGEKEYLF